MDSPALCDTGAYCIVNPEPYAKSKTPSPTLLDRILVLPKRLLRPRDACAFINLRYLFFAAFNQWDPRFFRGVVGSPAPKVGRGGM